VKSFFLDVASQYFDVLATLGDTSLIWEDLVKYNIHKALSEGSGNPTYIQWDHPNLGTYSPGKLSTWTWITFCLGWFLQAAMERYWRPSASCWAANLRSGCQHDHRLNENQDVVFKENSWMRMHHNSLPNTFDFVTIGWIYHTWFLGCSPFWQETGRCRSMYSNWYVYCIWNNMV